MSTGLKKNPVTLKSGVITNRDYEMDYRASVAVSTAVKKAKITGNPIARFDKETGTAYLEYADGRRENVE